MAVRLDQLRNADLNLWVYFAGLADQVTARAFSAMHSQPSRAWTVAELTRLSIVSRSTFATLFQERVGLGSIEYLQE